MLGGCEDDKGMKLNWEGVHSQSSEGAHSANVVSLLPI